MSDVLKILAVLLILGIVLRRKVFLGTVMAAGSLLLVLLYQTNPSDFLKGVRAAFLSPNSLEMTGTLVLTMVLENILRKTETLKRMVVSLSRFVPDLRLVAAAMPAVIGLLPSPGGAVFSAPMVNEASAGLDVSPERKAFINYWFRHIWEYVSPLYPGIILGAGIAQVTYRELALVNAPFAVSVVGWGFLFCFSGVTQSEKMSDPRTEGKGRAFAGFCKAFFPIFLIMVLVVVAGVSPVPAIGAVILSLFLVHRYSLRRILGTLRESISIRMLLVVAGILVFQETLRVSGALAGISAFFAASGLPVAFIVVMLPFVTGVMTGLTIAYVGITFPLLLPLIAGESSFSGLLALAFGSGFAGVMLSPLHLCLVLTREYFNADFAAVYRLLWFPSLLVLAAVIIPFMFLS
ncbi:MAG TPA: DUF401 family protein [Geobacteraceae bacterium]|nr:DUF401 family protein [Geobacteraceae bacterium]